jgi:hypothetical protein
MIDLSMENSMSNAVEKLENEIASLSDHDLRAFRAWFQEFDAARWDKQLASDVQAGKLDGLAAEAIEQYKSGQCRKL